MTPHDAQRASRNLQQNTQAFLPSPSVPAAAGAPTRRVAEARRVMIAGAAIVHLQPTRWTSVCATPMRGWNGVARPESSMKPPFASARSATGAEGIAAAKVCDALSIDGGRVIVSSGTSDRRDMVFTQQRSRESKVNLSLTAVAALAMD